jgi:hypothetical protein
MPDNQPGQGLKLHPDALAAPSAFWIIPFWSRVTTWLRTQSGGSEEKFRALFEISAPVRF